MKYYFECPNCQSDSSFSRLSEDPSLGAWRVPLVDPFAAVVYGDSRRRRVQCDNCGYLFRQLRYQGAVQPDSRTRFSPCKSSRRRQRPRCFCGRS